MNYTVTFLEEQLDRLLEAIFSKPGCEGAAYLLCGTSTTSGETRLLVRDVLPVRDEEYLARESLRLSIDSRSYTRVAKQAKAQKAGVIFVHSHPEGIAEFSEQDDREEPKLMTFLGSRMPDNIHGSIVVSGAEALSGRVWIDGSWRRVERVRVLGRRFRFLGRSGASPAPWFDRQVAAFGPQLQALISGLHIGVVGCGGTGSAVGEQLCRLGVGELSVFDGDQLEESNVTRVYGSAVSDAGTNKAVVLGKHLRAIGLKTRVNVYDQFIDREQVAMKLRNCDVVFGCTDLEAPRALLVQLALRYVIPVFDLGVKISSADGCITDITGRVTTLYPTTACLFCRGRITAERVAFEQLSPELKEARRKEGYAPELETRSPAVIMFTTAVAAQAVNELLHRLSGFMGSERTSTEVLLRFHGGHLGKNSQPPSDSCICSQRQNWGRGDSRDFLGVAWSS